MRRRSVRRIEGQSCSCVGEMRESELDSREREGEREQEFNLSLLEVVVDSARSSLSRTPSFFCFSFFLSKKGIALEQLAPAGPLPCLFFLSAHASVSTRASLALLSRPSARESSTAKGRGNKKRVFSFLSSEPTATTKSTSGGETKNKWKRRPSRRR